MMSGDRGSATARGQAMSEGRPSERAWKVMRLIRDARSERAVRRLVSEARGDADSRRIGGEELAKIERIAAHRRRGPGRARAQGGRRAVLRRPGHDRSQAVQSI